MSSSLRRRLAAGFTLAAGTADTTTGLLLVFAPAGTLGLMVAAPVPEPLFLSFVGAFVAAVGIAYLWALAAWRRSGSPEFLRAVWRVTILFRAAPALFAGAHLLAGRLDPAWWSVPATDLACVAIQGALLAARWPEGRDG